MTSGGEWAIFMEVAKERNSNRNERIHLPTHANTLMYIELVFIGNYTL